VQSYEPGCQFGFQSVFVKRFVIPSVIFMGLFLECKN